MPDWSIKIGPPGAKAPTLAVFTPDVYGQKPNDPVLHASDGDLVTWNNTTGDTHQPWPADANFDPLPDAQVSMANGNYLSDPIPAGFSSSPSYNVVLPTTPGNILNYCCKLHKGEHGQIGPQPTPAGPTV
jgi:hypothetical protein